MANLNAFEIMDLGRRMGIPGYGGTVPKQPSAADVALAKRYFSKDMAAMAAKPAPKPPQPVAAKPAPQPVDDPDSAVSILALAESVGLKGFARSKPARQADQTSHPEKSVQPRQHRDDPDSADNILALAKSVGLRGFT